MLATDRGTRANGGAVHLLDHRDRRFGESEIDRRPAHQLLLRAPGELERCRIDVREARGGVETHDEIHRVLDDGPQVTLMLLPRLIGP